MIKNKYKLSELTKRIEAENKKAKPDSSLIVQLEEKKTDLKKETLNIRKELKL